MADIIVMPKLGFNMDSGKLVKWHKQAGDAINKGDLFFAVQTDKTIIDIESTSSGFVRKQFFIEGNEIKVTLPISIITPTEDEDITLPLNKCLDELGLDHEDRVESCLEEVVKSEEIDLCKVDEEKNELSLSSSLLFSPRARKYLSDKGLNVSSWNIVGTGYQGGVTEKDIILYEKENKVKVTPVARNLASLEGVDLSSVSGTGYNSKIVKSDIEKSIAAKVAKNDVQDMKFDKEISETIPYTGMRKIIGTRLSESMYSAPHVSFKISANLEKLLSLKNEIQLQTSERISVTDFIAKAVSKAILKVPVINSSLKEDSIEVYKTLNLGIAVGLEEGLIVPVIRNVHEKTILQVSQEAKILIEKARSGKLLPQDYQGGTFTISNLGMFGVEDFTAIINPPESAILAVSTIEKKYCSEISNDKEIVTIKPVISMRLSVDHRVIDGMQAAQFVSFLKETLENPVGLLI